MLDAILIAGIVFLVFQWVECAKFFYKLDLGFFLSARIGIDESIGLLIYR